MPIAFSLIARIAIPNNFLYNLSWFRKIPSLFYSYKGLIDSLISIERMLIDFRNELFLKFYRNIISVIKQEYVLFFK